MCVPVCTGCFLKAKGSGNWNPDVGMTSNYMCNRYWDNNTNSLLPPMQCLFIYLFYLWKLFRNDSPSANAAFQKIVLYKPIKYLLPKAALLILTWRFLQSSLDPVFRADLCIVEISILCLSGKMSYFRGGGGTDGGSARKIIICKLFNLESGSELMHNIRTFPEKTGMYGFISLC
jgi:hypothetical protein